MKGTIVFDFDYTLADTSRFKEELASVADQEAVIMRMSEFMFAGAEALLRRLRAEDWKLALLTVGDPAWQARKLAGSGLLPLFDYVLYTAEPKETRVAEFAAWPEPLVFVNDNGDEIDALCRALPSAKMIAVRGPKPEPSAADVPLCDGLEEVYKILAQG